MPAAVAIPAIIGAAGAGASLVGAKMASNASKDAARLQIQATDKAQQFNERVYADQKQLMDPYVKGGTEAFQRLMAQHWGTAVPANLPPSSGGANAFLGQQAQMTMPRPPAGSLAAAQAQPPGGRVNPTGVDIGTQPAPTLDQYSQALAASKPQGQMVRVKAPTGEMAQFPDGSPGLQQALAKGAVRV